MVARVTTLKASGDKLGALVEYYAGLADRTAGSASRGLSDYYLDPDEPAGRWCGSAGAELGLEGEVGVDQFGALLAGAHPSTGAPLGRAFGERSARGFDVTFSAPKSVSVMWALAEDSATREQVVGAHDAAVAATLEWIETHGAVTRRGRDGVHQVDSRGLAVAVFRQHTSRTADPQIHSHAVVSAKVQDATGRWLSLDARWLKTQQRSISWVYDAALRAELTARLALDWEPPADGAGQADLICVPPAVRDVFSQRTRQVEAKLAELVARWSEEHDGGEPDARQVAVLERRSVATSRPTKRHGLHGHLLRAEWAEQAAGAGFHRSRLADLALGPVPGSIPGSVPGTTPLPALGSGVPGSTPGFVPGSGSDLDRETLIVTAIIRASRESATWLPTDLSRHLAALLPPSAAASGQELTRLVDDLTHQAVARCVELHPPAQRLAAVRADGRPQAEAVTDRRLTTNEVWAEEERLQQWATVNAGRPTSAARSNASAVAAAVAGWERLVLVVGPAGAGKTTMLADAVARLQRQGRVVVGAAPSGKAADVLAAETGCPSTTLARVLVDQRALPPRRATILVDEAAMAATDQLARLVALAETRDWRLVCVGDPAQLPAVGRAGMFARWCEALPAHHLTEVHRFSHGWEAEASLALRRGAPDAATAYADHHRLRAIHPALLPAAIAVHHRKLADSGKTLAITTATTTTARTINLEIQRRARQQSRRTGWELSLADGTSAGVGDTITTRRNSTQRTDRDVAVRNRHTWTVARTHRDGSLTVTHPQRGTVRLPSDYVAEHVELGWAVTGYGNQGLTADAAVAVVEPSSTRAGIYVAMTRGREQNVAVIPDPTGTLDPEDAFTQAVTRPTAALTAHAVRDHLHRVRHEPVERFPVGLERRSEGASRGL
jgi:conjugative relaxase-like TrwC/TraI family protein